MQIYIAIKTMAPPRARPLLSKSLPLVFKLHARLMANRWLGFHMESRCQDVLELQVFRQTLVRLDIQPFELCDSTFACNYQNAVLAQVWRGTQSQVHNLASENNQHLGSTAVLLCLRFVVWPRRDARSIYN